MNTIDLSIVAPAPVATTPNQPSTSGRQVLPGDGKNSPPAPASVTRQSLAEAVTNVSDYVQNISRELQFQVDDNTGVTVVTVRDSTTEEVIRQIPSEEMLAMARHIREQQPDPAGLFLDGKV